MQHVTYIQEAPHFSAEGRLEFGAYSLRCLSASQASQLANRLANRNVFARHGRDRDYYVRQAHSLAGKVVITSESSSASQLEASAIQDLIVLATTFTLKRSKLQRHIVSRTRHSSHRELSIDTDGRPSTQTASYPPLELLDAALHFKRYSRLGFLQYTQPASSLPGFFGARIRLVSEWLVNSRVDTSVGSAYIKTGTAAESLIAGASYGNVTNKVSQRIAKLVAKTPAEFDEVRKTLRSLYNTRCDFAHGRHAGAPTDFQVKALEAFDRLIILGLASFSANCSSLSTISTVDNWFEQLNVPIAIRPFPANYVKQALRLAAEK